MLFRRRTPVRTIDKVKQLFWPQKGYARSLKYLRLRILRLTATPHAIAAGVAAGVLSAWTPFLGLHIVIGIALAYVLAGNMAAAALGTTFANPVTYPLISASTLGLGNWMLGRSVTAHHVNLHALILQMDIREIWSPFLYPMLLGAIPLGLLFAGTSYLLTFLGVRKYQERRRQKLVQRMKERMQSGLAVSS